MPLVSGFCIFHEKDYLQDMTNYENHKRKILERLEYKVNHAISNNKPLLCIGFQLHNFSLSDLSFSKEFTKPIHFSAANLQGGVLFNKANFQLRPDFNIANFEGRADFRKINVRNIDPTYTVTPLDHTCPAGFRWDESSQSYQSDVVVHPPRCDPGFHWDETQQKCVPDVVVVAPSGDVLWDSNTNGHWNNGHSRVITSAHQFDPDDPTTEVAAGSRSDRRFEVKGDGTALLSGARARIYTHVNNYDAQMEVTFVMNSTLDNLSLRLRSRHNEYDPHENRFGGFGCSIAHGTFKVQRENFHNDHTTIKNDTSLPRNLENDKSYTVRFSVFDDANKKVVHKIEIDYDGNGTFTPIITINDNNPLAYMVDRNRYEGSGDKSYIWVRTDGSSSPKNVELKRLIIRKITSDIC
jgi:hypothetical protein